VVFAQGEIGGFGLADDPPDGLETYYMFTGVYNKESGSKFATVVHCTNIGSTAVNVKVEFFAGVGGLPATLTSDVDPSETKSFSTQAIASWPNLVSPATPLGVEIQHGSGWVRAVEGSEIICTTQIVALDGTGVPIDIAKLHLFDSNGDMIDVNPGPENAGDIFLPLILKGS
ncbi:MAG: hypothetical protein JXM69_20670, partial [Anaerolineae bacterium]|nr:hypothetical protein [Anaerolineae bacterium]